MRRNFSQSINLKVLNDVEANIVALGGGAGNAVLIVDDLVDTGTPRSCAASFRRRMSRPSTPNPWAGQKVSQDTWTLGHRAGLRAADPQSECVHEGWRRVNAGANAFR